MKYYFRDYDIHDPHPQVDQNVACRSSNPGAIMWLSLGTGKHSPIYTRDVVIAQEMKLLRVEKLCIKKLWEF